MCVLEGVCVSVYGRCVYVCVFMYVCISEYVYVRVFVQVCVGVR